MSAKKNEKIEKDEDGFPLPVTELVTPAKATNWLENSKFDNRPISDRMVDKIVRDIKANKWIYDGNSIKFDKEGNVIDGQHRLWAVIKSQGTVRMLVIRGFDRSAVNTIDNGKPRSNADLLHFNGFKNTAALANACRISLGWKNCDNNLILWAKNRSAVVTSSAHELIKEVEGNKLLREACTAVSSMKFVIKFVGFGTGAFCYSLFSAIDRIAANEFFYLLDKGISLKEGHPIIALRSALTLRDHIFSRITRGGNYRSAYIIALIIKSWNAYRGNKSVKSVVFRDEIEKYPQPI